MRMGNHNGTGDLAKLAKKPTSRENCLNGRCPHKEGGCCCWGDTWLDQIRDGETTVPTCACVQSKRRRSDSKQAPSSVFEFMGKQALLSLLHNGMDADLARSGRHRLSTELLLPPMPLLPIHALLHCYCPLSGLRFRWRFQNCPPSRRLHPKKPV